LKLKKSLILLAVLCLGLLSGIALFVPLVKADSQFESFTQFQSWASVYWNAGNGVQFSEAFTPATNHTVTAVKLYLQKTGSPLGNLSVSIRLASSHLPTGSDLVNGQINASTLTTSGVWYQINMTSEYPLKANSEYTVVLNDSSDGNSNCPQTGQNYTASYSNGKEGLYNFGWGLTVTNDMEFQIWGNPVNASTYDAVTVSSTNYNTNATFQTRWNDYFNVSGFIFGSNLTGSWINQPWTPFVSFNNSTSAYSQNTILINASIGSKVQWQVSENNTVGLWNNTGLQIFTVTNAFLYEQNTPIATYGYGNYPPYWTGETFQLGSVSHSITSIWLYMKVIGNPNGVVTASIRATTNPTYLNGYPSGLDLTSGTASDSVLPTSWAWIQINVTEYQLQANTKYALLVRDSQGTSTTNCSAVGYVQTDSYSSGTMLISSSSGVVFGWYATYDMLFQIVGYSVPTITNFQTDQANTVQYVPFFLNCTVSDYRGTGNISSVSVEFSDLNQIIASWNSSGFSITQGVEYLTASGCKVTALNSSTEVMTWEITSISTQAEDVVRVLSSQTLVTDTFGLTGTNSLDKLFSYSISTTPQNPTNQNPTNTNPETNATTSQNPSPTNTTAPFMPPTIPQTAVTAFSDLSPIELFAGVVVIFVVVGFVGMYAGGRKPETKEQAMKLWKRQLKTKRVKWNGDND
jgi:hypothetical protein